MRNVVMSNVIALKLLEDLRLDNSTVAEVNISLCAGKVATLTITRFVTDEQVDLICDVLKTYTYVAHEDKPAEDHF